METTAMTTARKVLLVELNEINWRVIDSLIAQHGTHYLPNFTRLREQGAWAEQTAVEKPPHLDPWVTWVTVHTGVPRDVHHATVLEQDSTSIASPRLWDYAVEGGRSVGVFGSISAYPPRKVPGFMVPGPFAPGDETYPDDLRPVQAINRLGTRMHGQTGSKVTPMMMARDVLALMRLGLRVPTLMKAATEVVRGKLQRGRGWRLVSLQPIMNFDFFAHAYRRFKPDFATWHSNHAAHYMHHYWRAWDDRGFPAPASEDERRKYGDAVPYGYRLCDDLLGRFMRLAGDDTVLVVASSMGQQPYVSELYKGGKLIVRVRDIDRVLAVLGSDGIIETVPTMVPQWNIKIPDAAHRAEMKRRIEAVRRTVGGREEAAMAVEEVGDTLTMTPLGLSGKPEGIRYFFHGAPAADPAGYAIDDLFATDTPTVKQGMHHPSGLLAFHGAGIRAGVRLPECTNLDIAPTLLTLMELPVPPAMPGRVLSEAWRAPDSHDTPAPKVRIAATA
jgi:hypothetical protein